jgi:hypothetical protein
MRMLSPTEAGGLLVPSPNSAEFPKFLKKGAFAKELT